MEQGGVRPHPGDSPDRDQAPLLTTGASVSNDRQPAAMAMTTAERQRAFRRRQTDHIATLEQENAQLRAALADVLAEAERLASTACMHPAAAVDGGHCHACDTDIW